VRVYLICVIASFPDIPFSGDSLMKYVKKTMNQLATKDNELIKPQLEQKEMYPDVSQFFLKGYLFFPLTDDFYSSEITSDAERVASLCKFPAADFESVGISPAHSRGWWARYHHEFTYDPEEIETRLNDGEMVLGALSTAELLASDDAGDAALLDLEEDVLLLETDDNPVKKTKLASSKWIVRSSHFFSPIPISFLL
jgi:hypothetical protein